jgi:Flp pilus assembly protein TadD
LADAADAHYQLAKTLRAEGRYEEALAEIDLAVAARPTYAQGHVTRGSILRRLGRYEEALKAFKRAIQLEPKDGRAHGLAGAALLRLNRPKEAVKYLEKATTLEPKHSNHWLNLGVAYRQSKNNQAAIATYQRALKVIPNDPKLLNNLGVALRKARRYDESIQAHEPKKRFRSTSKRSSSATAVHPTSCSIWRPAMKRSATPTWRSRPSTDTSRPPKKVIPKELSGPNARSRTSRRDSEVGKHRGRRVVSGGADDRPGGVAAGSAGVKPRHGKPMRQSVGETKGVVNVVDVPGRDAKVGFNFRRSEREDVLDQL